MEYYVMAAQGIDAYGGKRSQVGWPSGPRRVTQAKACLHVRFLILV
jgi:hypothetical protein